MRPLLRRAVATVYRVYLWLTWQHMTRALGVVIVVVEIREVHGHRPVDQGLLLLAAGLLGLATAIRKNGNGRE